MSQLVRGVEGLPKRISSWIGPKWCSWDKNEILPGRNGVVGENNDLFGELNDDLCVYECILIICLANFFIETGC